MWLIYAFPTTEERAYLSYMTKRKAVFLVGQIILQLFTISCYWPDADDKKNHWSLGSFSHNDLQM